MKFFGLCEKTIGVFESFQSSKGREFLEYKIKNPEKLSGFCFYRIG